MPALLSLRTFALMLGVVFLSAAASGAAHAAKKAAAKKSGHAASVKKSGKASSLKAPSAKKKKKGARKSRRRGRARGPLREVRPDFPEPSVPDVPPGDPTTTGAAVPLPTPTKQAAISPAVVEALARGNVSGAILAMREDRDSPKLRYLNRQASRIVAYQMDKKVDRAEAHQVYQNLGISSHNLYLFLKAKGIEQKKYVKEAERFYRKARGAGSALHKTDCDLLRAALIAAAGEKRKAEKIYARIRESEMRGDFDSMEYLAAYHAAAGHVDGALAALDAMYRLNPASTLTWLAIGDDFDAIASEPQFKALMVAWKAEEASRNLKRSLPKAEKKRAKGAADDGTQFRPQKSMKRYELKKAKAGKKSASVKSKRHGGKKKSKSAVKKPAASKSPGTQKK